MIPLIILAIEDESSREFMIRLYESSVKRMYCEAKKFFSETEDVEDAVSDMRQFIFCGTRAVSKW